MLNLPELRAAALAVVAVLVMSCAAPSSTLPPTVTPSPLPAATSNATPSPSPTPAPSATPSRSPTVQPTPSATVAPTASPDPNTITVPSEAIRTVQTFESQPYVAAQSGPRLALVDNAHAQTLYIVDLTTETMTPLARASVHQVLGVALSDTEALWVDGRFDGNVHSIPCGSQGRVTWTIKLTKIETAISTTVDSGRSNNIRFCTAAPPSVAIDGDLMAYGVEHPRPDNKKSWRIIVASVADGRTQRVIDTDLELVELEIDGGDVAYIEGIYTRKRGFPNPVDTRLMLSTADLPSPRQIDDNVSSLDFNDGQLAWYADGENALGVVTTWTIRDVDRAELGDGSYYPSPATSGDAVFFPTRNGLSVWLAATGQTFGLDVKVDPYDVSANDDWLTWVDHTVEPEPISFFVQGVPLSEIPLPTQ